MIAFIAQRRPIGINTALIYITDLFITVPDTFKERHLELILLGMTALGRETDLRTSADNSPIDTAGRPRVRKRAVKLASQLWRYYQDRGKAIPTQIEQWKTIAENDPLAFVRNAWTAV